ncbi:MAG: MazG-like family protein [Eubacteriales bacterium]|nr:MazG-like family protein [Eubacteriales bacterium]
MKDETLSIREMYLYQQRLQEKYARQWGEPIEPDTAVRKLLWAHGELAEAGDILKKNGPIEEMLTHPEKKRHLAEELGDAMMYMYDVMLCCGITPEEFSEIYKAKCERNKNRW